MVGVRTNVRGEDVRICRLRVAPAQARALLIEYIAEANELVRTPPVLPFADHQLHRADF
jgi:hypothetical protein